MLRRPKLSGKEYIAFWKQLGGNFAIEIFYVRWIVLVYGFVKGCKEPCLREQNLWTRHSGSMKTDLRSLVEWIVTAVLNRSLNNPHTHENMAMNIQELRYCLEYHPLFSLDSLFSEEIVTVLGSVSPDTTLLDFHFWRLYEKCG